MQWDYVYADLQLQVTFDAEASSVFGQLTDGETMVLQQLVYHGLMIFLQIRTLYAADAVEFAKRMENCRPTKQERDKGG